MSTTPVTAPEASTTAQPVTAPPPDAAAQLLNDASQLGTLNAELLSRDLMAALRRDPVRTAELLVDLGPRLTEADQARLLDELTDAGVAATAAPMQATNLLAQLPPPLLAQAPAGSSGTQRNVLADVFSAAAPDALVYSNAALLAPANAKSFVLVNPLAVAADPNGRGFTHFIGHPQNVTTIGGVPFGRVEAISYNFSGQETRREDGLGYLQKFGQGQNQVTVFVNGRFGDTNLLHNPNVGVSANVGFFGSPQAMRQLIDGLPSSGRSGQLKQVLESALDVASVGGTQAGVAWRGTVSINRDTGKLDLNLSGLKIPLADFSAALSQSAALNHGSKPVARTNNEEAYLNGANPFQRADDTRTPAGAYVNHGDPVAAIAGDVLALQDRLNGTGEAGIRTNAQARSFLEQAIERSRWLTPEQRQRWRDVDGIEQARVDPNPMSVQDRAKLEGLLVQLDRQGVYFGSPTIQAAAADARRRAGDTGTVNPDERAFTRNVFEGDFRRDNLQGYGIGDGVRDLLLGVNRITAVVTSVFEATPTARDEDHLARAANTLQGFAQRMAQRGGTLSQLGLAVPAGVERADYEAAATRLLLGELRPRVAAGGSTISAESLFQAFTSLGAGDRRALAGRIDGALNAVDGQIVVGPQRYIGDVGGRNQATGEYLQGRLMAGSTDSGGTVYWLRGRETNYLLRDPQGRHITDPEQAEARARQLISAGAATDLRPLDPRYR